MRCRASAIVGAVHLVIGGFGEVQGRAWGWPTAIVAAVDDGREPVAQSSIPEVKRLVLEFVDTTDAESERSMSPVQTEQLVAFARDLGPAAERLIVHCSAGKGRSPALGYGLLVALGWEPTTAIAEVLRVRPVAQPNALVMWRLDEALAAQGALWRAYEDWARPQRWWPYPDERVGELKPSERLARISGIRRKRLT